MPNAFIRVSKKQKLIQLCASPMRYVDLKRETGLSHAGLTKDLRALQKLGWLKRVEGTYELTSAGRNILPQANILESILSLNFKRVAVLARDVTVCQKGLEGDDGETLLSDVAQAARRYTAKHSDKPITLLLQYVIRK